MPQAWPLFAELIRAGFALRVEDGQLLVAPGSKLTPSQTAAIRAQKDALILLVEESTPEARQVQDGILRAWDDPLLGVHVELWRLGDRIAAWNPGEMEAAQAVVRKESEEARLRRARKEHRLPPKTPKKKPTPPRGLIDAYEEDP